MLGIRQVGNTILRRKIFVFQCRKTSQGNPLLFHSFQVSKNPKNKRIWGGGASTSSAEDFLSHSGKSFVGQPFCAVFQKFAGAKKFREKKAQYQDYPSNSFSLRVPKNFVGQTC